MTIAIHGWAQGDHKFISGASVSKEIQRSCPQFESESLKLHDELERLTV
jgi:hypothetical protein